MTTFYVAPDGNDNWSGLKPEAQGDDGPFCTLARAKAAVRAIIAGGMNNNVDVILRGGGYYLEESLVFTPEDSGRDGFEISYRAYAGETPVIYAGLPISRWEPYDNNIYRASVDRSFNALYENGRRSVKARYPANGYSVAEAVEDTESHTQFRFKPGDIPQIENINELQVFIWPAGPQSHWNWFTDIININRVDFENQTITLSNDTRYIVGAGGSRYYVQGALELLTGPGQFYLDEREMVVYYWPRQTPIEEQTIIAPTGRRAFDFSGSSRDDVTANIVLDGLNITATDAVNEFGGRPPGGEFTLSNENGTIYFENAENITVRNCHIHDTGMHGVYGNNWVQGCTITGNLMENIGFTGVLLNGPWESIDYINHGNQITNNYIHHTGQVIGYGAGIQIANSGGNHVAYNRVHDTPRYAISIKGTFPGIMMFKPVDSIHVREGNVMSFVHTRHNVIEFNDMSRANTDSQDTGVFEGWGVYSAGNTVRNNLIHDSDIPFSFGFGVYLDDDVSNTTLTNNVIYNLQLNNDVGMLWGAFYVKGINNRIWNNVIARCRRSDSVIAMQGFLNAPNHSLEFARNVAYDVSDGVYRFRNWDRRKFARAEDNIYFNPRGVHEISGAPRVKTLDEWRAAFDYNYDQFTRTDDPLFVDYDANDFRLRYDSPAYAQGFEDINLRDIGLRPDFVYADTDEPVVQLFVTVGDSHKSYASVNAGDELQLDVIGRTQSGFVKQPDKLVFSSSDETVASVDAQGRVTAVEAGQARILVNMGDVSTSFDVLVDDRLDRIEILAPHDSLVYNETMPLRVVGRTRCGQYIRAEDAVVTFEASPPGTALVDYAGLVTAQMNVGETHIRARMRWGSVRKEAAITLKLGE